MTEALACLGDACTWTSKSLKIMWPPCNSFDFSLLTLNIYWCTITCTGSAAHMITSLLLLSASCTQGRVIMADNRVLSYGLPLLADAYRFQTVPPGGQDKGASNVLCWQTSLRARVLDTPVKGVDSRLCATGLLCHSGCHLSRSLLYLHTAQASCQQDICHPRKTWLG